MKFLVIVLIWCLSAPTSIADINDSSKEKRCTRLLLTETHQDKALHVIEEDLLSAVWHWIPDCSADGTEEILQFHWSGRLDVFKSEPVGNMDVEVRTWNITSVDDDVVLSITDMAGQNSEMYIIRQSCDGIFLTSLYNWETGLLSYQREKSRKSQLRNTENLLGSWRARVEENGDQDIIVEMTFNTDGTFSRVIDKCYTDLRHEGIWELSEDGNYIVLYYIIYDESDLTFENYLYKVSNLDFNAMEISINQGSERGIFGTNQTFLAFDKMSFPIN
jgi:hypothetical protein